MLCKKRADVFKPGDHASTFGGNPLACAAANCVTSKLDVSFIQKKVVPAVLLLFFFASHKKTLQTAAFFTFPLSLAVLLVLQILLCAPLKCVTP